MRQERSAGSPARTRSFPAFSPQSSTIVHVRPTARGVGVAAILVALLVGEAILRNSALFVFVVVLGLPLVVAPLLAASRARRARAAQVRIMVAPPLVPVDAPCELILQLSNQGARALPLLCLDGPAEHSRSQPSQPRGVTTLIRQRPSVFLAPSPTRLLRWEAVGAHQCSATVRNISTRHRGVFVVGPLRLWAHDPFGLSGLPVATAPPATVVVHPQSASHPASHMHPAGSPTTGSPRSGEIQIQSDDPAGEWSGLRQYVPGDRLHLLSWPAEALYGALLVDEFRPDGHARIRIVLDDRAGVHRREAFEAVLSTIHAFMVDADRQALVVELVALSGDQSMGSPVPEGIVEHLTFLARAQPRKETARARRAVLDSRVAGASVVVTTATARPSLPVLPGDPSVVVLG